MTSPTLPTADMTLRLVLRVEADQNIGLGHLVRCVALARRWRATGGSVDLVTTSLPAEWTGQLEGAGIKCWPVERLSSLAGDDAALVVDGYDLASTFDQDLSFRTLIAIDDFGTGGHGCRADLIVDQSISNAAPMPDSYAQARLLRGPRYALLRPEFENIKPDPVPGRLLISLGGRPEPGARRWSEDVVSRIRTRIEPVWLAGVEDVAALMRTSQVALAASGSTTWELCRAGVPAVLVAVTGNQRGVLETISDAGAGVTLGQIEQIRPAEAAAAVDALLSNPASRRSIASAATLLVDGLGSRRIVTAIRSGFLVTRRARPSDKRMYFEWANDEMTRASAFDPEPISWSTHDRWFDDRLARTTSLLLVVEAGGVPVGQFRVDRSGSGGTVDVTVAPPARGRALSASVIDCGTRAALKAMPSLTHLEALVLDANVASRHAFLGADYDETSEAVDGRRALRRYVRVRNDERDG